jgi:hypothetical protein
MISEFQFKFQQTQTMFLFSNVHTGSRAHPSLLLTGHKGQFPCRCYSKAAKLTIYLHLTLRLRMSERKTSTPPYDFTGSTGKYYFTLHKKMQHPKHNDIYKPHKLIHCCMICLGKSIEHCDKSVSHTSAACITIMLEVHGSVFGWGTMLQAWRSRFDSQ